MRFIVFLTLLLLAFMPGCSRSGKRQYQFALESAAGLKENAPITYKGLQVGYVTHLRSSMHGPAIIATGRITDPNMHLLAGDSARVVTVALMGDPQIEIVRASESGTELPAETLVATSSQAPVAPILSELVEIAAQLRQLSPERQKQLSEEIHALIEKARQEETGSRAAAPK
jgi:ABC-type transporter Mla subunit MlaD